MGSSGKFRVLIIFGTRPEAIKLAPVILELGRHSGSVESIVCVTAQHREMLDQVLDWFAIIPEFDLNLMQENQTLHHFAGQALAQVTEVLQRVKPDLVLVQGDTTTVMMSALAAFYQKIPLGHVEAGLRTRDLYNPFPEEMNRRVTSVLAAYHFAPTDWAAACLRAEQVPENRIFVTGNTIVDALLWTLEKPLPQTRFPDLEGGRMILVTAHRRESFGAPFESLCRAIRALVERHEDVYVIYPVHLNPNVRAPVNRILSGHPRIHLLDPLRYEEFVHLMDRSYLILTDSGGIQEEAPVLGKPVLIMRETTERPEALELGTARLVGTSETRIMEEAERLLNDSEFYQMTARPQSPFGDGHAAGRIVEIILKKMGKKGEGKFRA